MLAQEQEVEVDVRPEDQKKINSFGKNNVKLTEIREEITKLRSLVETYDDANSDLMMADGEKVKLMISETFVECTEEAAIEYLEQLTNESNEQLKTLQSEEREVQSTLDGLKKELYARFGSSINLEA